MPILVASFATNVQAIALRSGALGTGHPHPSRRPASRSAISVDGSRAGRPGGPGNGSGPSAWLWIFELRYEAEAGAERSRVCKLCAPHALRPHCIGGRSPPPLRQVVRSSNYTAIRRRYGRHTNMAARMGRLVERRSALCDQIVWRGRVAAWHSNSQLPTPISTAHPGSRLPRTDARSSSGGYST